jgi:hypothetical protein
LSDCVKCRGYGFWVRNINLALAYHFFVEEIDSSSRRSEWLSTLREELDLLAHHPVGVLYLNLDELLGTDEDRFREFLSLTERVRERICSHGKLVPKEILNGWNIRGAGGGWTGDVPIEEILGIHDAFLRLLRNEMDETGLGPHDPRIERSERGEPGSDPCENDS